MVSKPNTCLTFLLLLQLGFGPAIKGGTLYALLLLLIVITVYFSIKAAGSGWRKAGTAFAVASVIGLMVTVTAAYLDSGIQHNWQRLVDITSSIMFLGYFIQVSIAIGGRLFLINRATQEDIFGALVVYILIGMIWALVYNVVEQLAPGSFRFPEGHVPGSEFEGFSLQKTEFVYYSFITLATVGFGDMLPLSPFCRMLTVTEAIMGQFYVVVFMARLVGVHLAGKSNPPAA